MIKKRREARKSRVLRGKQLIPPRDKRSFMMTLPSNQPKFSKGIPKQSEKSLTLRDIKSW